MYLHRLDRAWDTGPHGVLVRYCDDLVVMCQSREQAEAALQRLTDLLGDLGLEPKAAKTRIVHLIEGGQGLDFLGFHNRLVRGRTPRSAPLIFLARWPARRAVQHARDLIRAITARAWLLVPVTQIVEELNRTCEVSTAAPQPQAHARYAGHAGGCERARHPLLSVR